MNPQAPPKTAEKIMNERIARVSHRWRRAKRRMPNLIRTARPIANPWDCRNRDCLARQAFRDCRARVFEDDDETATLQSA